MKNISYFLSKTELKFKANKVLIFLDNNVFSIGATYYMKIILCFFIWHRFSSSSLFTFFSPPSPLPFPLISFPSLFYSRFLPPFRLLPSTPLPPTTPSPPIFLSPLHLPFPIPPPFPPLPFLIPSHLSPPLFFLWGLYTSVLSFFQMLCKFFTFICIIP